ncbi:unnamed protein product [Candida verbasci]|uniref:L-ornithine N(5)-monooxygenase [NAD(P)H] n=1 Tax=Candida verbasci TaxID=1227364 RepID=A0A9W4TUS6_9ASCO|nr:unnamed protein product [Candida verbasci]
MKYDNFGGTWYANTYPCCACDVPAVWYSLSFALNSNWSTVQPPQYEIEEYILKVTEHHKLKDKTKFKTSIEKYVYDDVKNEWIIYGHEVNGRSIIHRAKFLLACQAEIVYPNHLRAEGLEDFHGSYIHSALWDHSVDFKSKDVVVVGNGSSGNQCVPALLKDYEVNSLTQVIRSKHYIIQPFPTIFHSLYNLLSWSYIGIYLVRLI